MYGGRLLKCRRLVSGAALLEGAGWHRTSLNCTMWGCIKDLWFMISRSTYLVTCRRQAGSRVGNMTDLLVQLWVRQALPGRLSEGAHCQAPGLADCSCSPAKESMTGRESTPCLPAQ